jgi:histidyl-tRNA synthetase
MALSTKPYRGARDFYPEDKRLQKYIFSVWSNSVERFGYEEYDAPILEPLDIYLAKSGQEIVSEQTYVFKDRGDRMVVIRPEMTPTVSRMVANKRQELTYPVRWYSIPNLWRYERPQRGRLREHWQLNVDIFGVQSVSAELEIINLVDTIFKNFGASESMYEIKLNNRQLTNLILNNYLKLDEEKSLAVIKLIDRIEKMERSQFLTSLDEILSDKDRQNGVNQKLMAILDTEKLSDLPSELKKDQAYTDIATLIESLDNSGLKHVKYSPNIMRGFDYYTGIVFEVFDTNPENNRSMMGGGRYDGLVGLFGVEPVPTVGFGWGDVTLENFLVSHDLLPKLDPETKVYVVLAGDVNKEAQSLLKSLRDSGVNVMVDLGGKKLGDQLKAADKRGIKLALIIGEEEIKSGEFTLRNLESRKELKLNQEDLLKHLK